LIFLLLYDKINSKGSEIMAENKLKHADGIKIRKQYFKWPLVFFGVLAFGLPYLILVCSVYMGKFNFFEWLPSIGTSFLICFVFSLPFIVLSLLNRRFFGKTVCVLAEEGILYPKEDRTCLARWSEIEKIEYAVDTKPRYKNDPCHANRTIIYKSHGHVVLRGAPRFILKKIKQIKPELDTAVTGRREALSSALVIAVIALLLPIGVMLFVTLLSYGQGISTTQTWVMFAAILITFAISLFIFDAYTVQYRFWSKILVSKWRYRAAVCAFVISMVAAFLVAWYFPSLWTVIAASVYIGVVTELLPRRHLGRRMVIMSYEEAYGIYVEKADFWEKQIQKKNAKR
jgi:hypothetical protein